MDQKLQFTYPQASIKDVPKLQKKPSALKREHPVLQSMELLNFFLLLWVIFALLDPDPDSEYGSETLVGMQPKRKVSSLTSCTSHTKNANTEMCFNNQLFYATEEKTALKVILDTVSDPD